MRTNLPSLEERFTQWHADAEPPPSLRRHVLKAADNPPEAFTLTARTNHHRFWWATGTAVALSGVCATLFLAASTSARPAYADVERAMKQVKTVQWDTEWSELDVPTGKVFRFTTHNQARLNPPALRTIFQHDFKETSFTIETPKWKVSQQKNRAGKTVRTRERWEKATFRWFTESTDPVERLRTHIYQKFQLPELTTPDNPNETIATEVIEGGRRLIKFDSTLGKRRAPDRLTRPGYRASVWADPTTRRAVRTQHEYYDGTKHSVVISKNFRYDEPLPDAIFDASRTQETLVK